MWGKPHALVVLRRGACTTRYYGRAGKGSGMVVVGGRLRGHDERKAKGWRAGL